MKKLKMHPTIIKASKKLKLLSAALMIYLVPLGVSAQSTTVIDLATGIKNNTNEQAITTGQPDDTWSSVTSPDGKTVVPLVSWTNVDQQWIHDGYGSMWVTAKMHGYPDLDDGGYYTYKMTFTNSCSGAGLNSKIVIRRIAVDNDIVTVYVNNKPHKLYALNGFKPSRWETNITVPLAAGEILSGTNEIKIVFYNSLDKYGFKTEAGFNMDADLFIDNTLNPVIQGATSFCANTSLTFTGSVTNGIPTNHYWEISECDGLGNVIPGGYEWHSWYTGAPGAYTFPGNVVPPCGKYYKVKLAVSNSCIGWAETATYIGIQCGPVVNAGADLALCPGQTKMLGINDMSKYITYSWSPGNWLVSPNSKATNISIPAGFTAPCPTSTTYVLTATSDQTGCTSKDAAVVSYATQKSVSTVSQSGGHGGCNYDVTLTANACGQGITYYWENGTSGPTTVVNSPTGNNINLTTSNVCFTNNQPAYSNADLLCFHPKGAFPGLNYPTNLYVNWSGNFPEGGFIVYDQTKPVDAPRAFNANRLSLRVWRGNSNYFSNTWSTEDCEGFRNSNFFHYNCVFNGSPLQAKRIYDFEIIMYNCDNSHTITGQFYIDGHRAPENVSISSIEESVLENKIYAYPTAASSNVIISINSIASANYSILLRDVLGKQVLAVTKAVEPGSNESDIDVSNLKNGIYFLTVTDGENTKNEKIVVSH